MTVKAGADATGGTLTVMEQALPAGFAAPPHVHHAEDEPWYDYLDRLDDASRRRRQRAQTAERPAGRTRDEVAAWVARRHLIADSSINTAKTALYQSINCTRMLSGQS